MAELGPDLRNQHVTDVSDRHTDVPEVSWAGAAYTVKSNDGHLVKDLLAHWQPMKHIMKNWGDVLKLASTDDQTGSSIQNHLQLMDDLRPVRRVRLSRVSGVTISPNISRRPTFRDSMEQYEPFVWLGYGYS